MLKFSDEEDGCPTSHVQVCRLRLEGLTHFHDQVPRVPHGLHLQGPVAGVTRR